VRNAFVAVDARRPCLHRGHRHLNGRRFARINRLDRMAIAAFPRVEAFIIMAGAPPIDI
jgi:hypothetical protein